jgi:putative transposase
MPRDLFRSLPLSRRLPEIWAYDFFTVPTFSLKTLYVFFFIEHGRRKLIHVNVTAHPTADWVWRQLIQATPWASSRAFSCVTAMPALARASWHGREALASRRC